MTTFVDFFCNQIVKPLMEDITESYLGSEWFIDVVEHPDYFFEMSSNILLSGSRQMMVSQLQYNPKQSSQVIPEVRPDQIKDFVSEFNNQITGIIKRVFIAEELPLGQSLPISYKTYFAFLSQEHEYFSSTEESLHMTITHKPTQTQVLWSLSFKTAPLPMEAYSKDEDDEEIDFL